MTDPRPDIDEAADLWRVLNRRLDPGETVWLTMLSGSMLPVLPVGARVAVKAVDGDGCRVGDIVAFRRDSRLIAHRLVFGWGGRPAGWFLERGDGASDLRFLRPGDILGRIVAVREAHGPARDLTGPDHRWRDLRAARRSLAHVLLEAVLGPLRKAKRWVLRQPTDSGSATSSSD